MNVFPITDELAILVRFQSTALIHIPSQEIRWTITCPALEAALDIERNMLALGAKEWVYLWDLQSGSLKQTFRLASDDIPTALSFNPQGSLLAIAPYDDAVQIWRIADGQLVHTLALEEVEYGAYKSIAFSPDGQLLAAGNFEAGEVWLWHVPDGQLLQQMEPSVGRVQGLAFSPDGQLLVCGDADGGEKKIEMRVWDVQTKHTVQSFPRKDWHPTFSPDGKLLASGDLRLIMIWDVATRKNIRWFPAHTGRLYRIKFSPSGRILVTIGDRKPTIRWWNVESGREIYRIEASY